MGTSSNFGNMFSAAAASAFLPFLPMLPSQILLNNLLYDSSQLAIPTDHVDEEAVRRPTRWDLGLIKRFMLVFGPASSVFDFATFALMLGVLHADSTLFRSGWFVESLATQTLVIFAIRTRRVPFVRSRPSSALVLAASACVAIGVLLPMSPLADPLGFTPLPPLYFLLLGGMVLLYFGLVELTKTWLFARPVRPHEPTRPRQEGYRVHRRAARFSHRGPLNPA
jgi:Mg2+-importing ATPase